MKKLEKADRRFIIILVSIVSLTALLIIMYNLSFRNGYNTCGRFNGKEFVNKGRVSYEYEYIVDNETYSSHCDMYFLSLKDIDSLKKIECVEITYSKWITNFSKVTDKRIIN